MRPPATTQTLLDAGFDVISSSALISYDQPLFPGEQFAVPNVRTLQAQQSLSTGAANGGKVLGHLNTIWTPIRYIADSLWASVDLAAAILVEGADVDSQVQAQKFSQNYYGLNEADAERFAEVMGVLLEESPMRSEWLAVVRLEPLSDELRERVMNVSPKWLRAESTLKRLSPSVRKHAVEFGAFSLLVEMFAHIYDAAAQFADSKNHAANQAVTTSKLLRRGESILDRVDRAWDRERFADDPRKHTAPIASYQCDHLIPLLQTGVAVLRKKVSSAIADQSKAEATMAGQLAE